MKLSSTSGRTSLSLILVATLFCLFPLTQFAATKAVNEGDKTGMRQLMDEGPAVMTGMLSGTGNISINGSQASAGATVLNDSLISTGSDGNALIELYGLGRIELTPNTTAKLEMSPNRIQVTLDGKGKLVQSLPSGVIGQIKFVGDQAHLTVVRGELSTESLTRTQTIKAGENINVTSSISAVSKVDTLFETSISGEVAPPSQSGTPAGSNSFIGHGALVGLIIAGISAGIIIGVVVHNTGNNNDTVLSPVR
jgi:hypothetical protein